MTGKIPEELIEQIRSQSDIVDVISEYVQLTKRGRNWFGLCPFHGENTPSFSVSQEKQIYHCFGCGAGGNSITFLMDIENIPFQDAVVKLGERVGIDLGIQVGSIGKSSNHYSESEEKMLNAHQFAADFYHHLLLNTEDGEDALNYLLKRGFTKEDIETNGIGWSLPTWDALTTLLKREQYSLDEISESGLIIKKESDHSYFDRFRARIMFPIRDEYGKIIAFSGRILHPSQNDAKYLNSPESPIFHKSQVLYNLDKARSSIRKTGQVILMEGFMDVLAANKAGIQHAVATMGTSLTPQHITKLKRLVNKVIICYDGDNAGWEAAKRAAEMLHEENLNVEIAILPEKLDPDEYIRKYGAESFRRILEKPHAYISFIMLHARRNKNFQFENDILQYIQEVIEHLVGKSPIERDLYIKQLANETNISEDAIYAQFRKLEAAQVKKGKRTNQNYGQTIEIEVRASKTLSASERAERLLLSHMLNNADVVFRFINNGDSQPFVRDEYMAVFIRLVGFYEAYESADYHRFLEVIEDTALRKIIMEAALVERDPEHAEEEIADCIKQLKKYRIELKIKELLHESKEAEKMHEYKLALEKAQQAINLRKTLETI